MMSDAAAHSRDVQNPYSASALSPPAGSESKAFVAVTKVSAVLGALSVLCLASMIAYVATISGEAEMTGRMVFVIGTLVMLSIISGLVGFVLGAIGAFLGEAKRPLTWFALISNSIILLILLLGVVLKLASGQPFFPH
jgi:hypothetical protein